MRWGVEDVIERQLSKTRATWEELELHGVTDSTELRLDFTYEAPTGEAAGELSAFLRSAIDYDVRADVASVTGTTKPSALSLAVIDDWVAWMVRAGDEHGRCKFAGWGTTLPPSTAQ